MKPLIYLIKYYLNDQLSKKEKRTADWFNTSENSTTKEKKTHLLF